MKLNAGFLNISFDCFFLSVSEIVPGTLKFNSVMNIHDMKCLHLQGGWKISSILTIDALEA